MSFAKTPAPPYWAVIFTSQRTAGDAGYGAMAERMEALVHEVPGFLGVESVRGPDGFGLTVSYFESEAAISAWRTQVEHLAAQRLGRERWYEAFEVRVARVERVSSFRR